MSFDRVLQLKLVADVADINRKMGGVTAEVSRTQRAFASLKSFAGPVMVDLAMQGINLVADSFRQQLEHAQKLEEALRGLGQVGRALGLPADKIQRVSDSMRDIGVSLGVGEDAKIVAALADVARITKDIGLSEAAVASIFDAMRLLDVDFDTAKGLVINGLILGRSRQLDRLGVSGDTAAERLGNFSRDYGLAAEEFAASTDGKWAVATAQWDGHMLNLAILVDEQLDNLKGVLVTAWNNLLLIIDGIALVWDGVATKWNEAIDGLGLDVGGIVDTITTALAPIQGLVDVFLVGPFDTAVGLLGAIWKAITLDLEGARDDLVGMVRGLANSVIDLLNDMSRAFAFSVTFELPKFEIPDPTQLLEGGTITIGGGTVDFSRGPLFDAIPHLAAGGIVRRPTLALIGEGAHDEAIVPLDGRRLGNTYQITVQAAASSPADVGAAVVEAIEAYERRAGAGWRR